MTYKVKMIFLNLILLAGITMSKGSAYADMSDKADPGGVGEQDQICSEIDTNSPSGQLHNDSDRLSADNCSLILLSDGCAVCTGCTGQCSLR